MSGIIDAREDISSSSALFLDVFENGRRHRNGSLHIGEDSGITVKDDWHQMRLETVLLMAESWIYFVSEVVKLGES